MLGETWKKRSKIDSNCKYNIYNNNNNDNNNNNKIQKIIKVLVILSKILMLLLKENKFIINKKNGMWVENPPKTNGC